MRWSPNWRGFPVGRDCEYPRAHKPVNVAFQLANLWRHSHINSPPVTVVSDATAVSLAPSPTQSRRLFRPFIRVLRSQPGFPTALLDSLEAESSWDERVQVVVSQELLRGAIALTGDEDLGLRAARATEVGDFEIIEYLTASAPTWRAALQTLLRYGKVTDGAADYQLLVSGGRARVSLGSTVPLSRAGVDFQLGSFYATVTRWLSPSPPGMRVHLPYPAVDHASEHARTFAGAELEFGSDFSGFSLDVAMLDTPMRTADAQLHGVLLHHADRLLAESETEQDWVARVRADLLGHMAQGRPSADGTAQRLGLSRRTLVRRLAESGTSFSVLLNDLRQQAAKRYLGESNQSVEDIAFVLGFSEAAPFVRAFKRWTGMAPIEYRRRSRTPSEGVD